MQENIPNGKIFIISGPSGVGKDYTVKTMSEMDEYQKLELTQPPSYTTRKRRSSDPDDTPYIFVSEEQFADLVENEIVEFTESHGHMYGTSKKGFENAIMSGANVLKILDKVGAKAFKKLYPENAIIIYLRPPSMEVLAQRLKGRASETPAEYSRRMADNLQELRDLSDYDYVVTAGANVQSTARIVIAIIEENI